MATKSISQRRRQYIPNGMISIILLAVTGLFLVGLLRGNLILWQVVAIVMLDVPYFVMAVAFPVFLFLLYIHIVVFREASREARELGKPAWLGGIISVLPPFPAGLLMWASFMQVWKRQKADNNAEAKTTDDISQDGNKSSGH